MTSAARDYVLLDRDGTIIVDKHYLSDPAGVELLPRAAQGLRRMQAMGLGLIVITNQSGIARGYFSEATLQAIHDRMAALLAAEGVTLDSIYHCPHGPDDGCPCRKPLPGMVNRAADEHGFDPANAYLIGDSLCDMDLGFIARCTTLLTTQGYDLTGGTPPAQAVQMANHVVADLEEAATVIQDLRA